MSDSIRPDGSQTQHSQTPDPEIEEILNFEPVPRRFKKEDGWTAPLQRAFIAELAGHGSPTRACEAVGKVRSGVDKLYKSPKAEGFRAAWDKAVELAERRRAAELRNEHSAVAGLRPPFVDHRRKAGFGADPGPLPGQMLNEHGEWEDADSLRRRAEEAKDNISRKLLNCRRLYLQQISSSPGKRAAFEILTELPIDWERAERLEPQPDEPFRRPNFRKPDMLLTAENGWMGDMAYGPNRMAEAREALNEELIAMGEEPIDWESEDAASESAECKAADAEQRADLHERREANSADESRSEPDRRHVGFTPRDDTASPSPEPDYKPGPRLRKL